MINTAALILLGMALSAVSAASDVSNAKTLLLRAIDAHDGKAKGVLVGPVAERIASTTRSLAPILANVTTTKAFQQEGCKRLNLRLTQADVPTMDGKKTVFAMDYGINLCRDGNPPPAGVGVDHAE